MSGIELWKQQVKQLHKENEVLKARVEKLTADTLGLQLIPELQRELLLSDEVGIKFNARLHAARALLKEVGEVLNGYVESDEMLNHIDAADLLNKINEALK